LRALSPVLDLEEIQAMMEPATITNLDDERLIRDGEAAAAEHGRFIKRGQDQIIPMARGLLAARRKYPTNQEFGSWFETSAYASVVTNHTMRAALIKIGEHEACAETVMRLTKSASPERILDGIQEILAFSENLKTPLQLVEPPKVDIPAEIPVNSQTAVADEPIEDNEVARAAPTLHNRHSFFGMPRGAELAAVFRGARTRQTIIEAIRGRGGKKIWSLIVAAYDGGLIPENKASLYKPSLALLCPVLPQRFVHKFDLTKPADRDRAEELLPRLIALQAAILARPDDIDKLLAEQEHRIKSETDQLRSEAAVAALPQGEREIVMFGRMVWPRQDSRQGEYSYRQICAAVWFFNDFERWSQLNPDNSVGSRATRARLIVKWLIEFLILEDQQSRIRPVLSLVQWLSRLLEDAPEAPCKLPPYPSNEGMW
jgi:hypothetical protein